VCDRELDTFDYAVKFFERILEQGQSRHECWACRRHLSQDEMPGFEEHVRATV
jgi:hypothetical protein